MLKAEVFTIVLYNEFYNWQIPLVIKNNICSMKRQIYTIDNREATKKNKHLFFTKRVKLRGGVKQIFWWVNLKKVRIFS